MQTLIIAEAGVNHNGDLAVAKQLIEVAAQAKASAVKFQTFRANSLASADAPKAAYQKELTDEQESQQAMLSKLELSPEDHEALMKKCQKAGILFLSSAFDLESLEFLLELDLEYLKIPSGEMTNYPFLKRAAEANLPTILSTGMATLGDIEAAVGLMFRQGLEPENLTLLQCTTAYPTPYDEVNLRAMDTLQRAFGLKVGLSDHTRGIAVSVAAVALGATVIEKHFTLDSTLPGPDHKASLEPDELTNLVTSIRQVESALGSSAKLLSPSEFSNREIARKSLHIASPLKAGERIGAEHLIAMRPGDGISPMKWEGIVGKMTAKSLPVSHKLAWSDLTS